MGIENKNLFRLSFFIAVFLLIGIAYSDVVTITTDYDGEVKKTSSCGDAGFAQEVGIDGAGNNARLYFRFPLSSIPSNAIITDVDLQINVWFVSNGGADIDIQAYNQDGQADPKTDTCLTRATRVENDPTPYVNDDTTTISTSGLKTIQLSSLTNDIITNIINAKSAVNRFSLAINKDSTSGLDVKSTLFMLEYGSSWAAKMIITYDTAPTFTIQYYSDSALINYMGNNPHLKAGTYYIKITSNEALSAAPTITINAEGAANDVTNAATTLVAGNDYKYTRTIASDAAAVGTTLEDISTTGTDAAGNTANNVNPTNEGTKAAYTDTTPPTAGAYTINGQSSGTVYTNGNLAHAWSGFSDANLYSFEIWRAAYSSLCLTGTEGTCNWAANLKDIANPASGSWPEIINGGDYWYGWHSSDKAGNWIKESALIRVRYDSSPPLTSVSINSGADYTTSTTITLGLSCTDSRAGEISSGMKDYQHNCTGTWSGWTSCSEPCNQAPSCILPSGDGKKIVQLQCRDVAGNIGYASDDITLDTTPPAISGGSPTGFVGVSNPTISVATNEIATCRWSTTQNINYNDMPVANTFTGSGDGKSHSYALSGLSDGLKNYYVRCADSPGNKNTVDYPITFTVDTTYPTVGQADIYQGTTYKVGGYWYKGTISISATASDRESGISGCEYTTSSAWFPATYDIVNQFCKKDIISPAIDIAINFRATNGATLTTTGTSRSYVYDNTAPTTTATATSGGVSYTFGTPTKNSVTVTLDCTDNVGGSGCTNMKYCTDTTNSCNPYDAGGVTYSSPFTISTEGTKYVRFGGTDNLQTQETSQSKTVIIDNTPPTEATVDVPVNTNYYKAMTMPVTFSGKARDNTGGGGLNANSVTFYIKSGSNYWTGSTWTAAQTWLATTHSATTGDTEITWTDNINLPAWSDGIYYVKAKAVDKVSNTFEGNEISFTYDNTPPTVNIDSPDASKWFSTDITVQYDATDANFASCTISTKDDGGSWSPNACINGLDQKLTITVGKGKTCKTEGTDMCSVEVYGKDKAGNENKVTRSFSIDLTPPTIDSISHSPTEYITPDTDVTITVQASDQIIPAGSSGLADIKIFVDGQLKQTCITSPCVFTAKYPDVQKTTHSYYAEANDKAGNNVKSSTNSFTVYIPEDMPLKKGWNIISIPYVKDKYVVTSSTCDSGRHLYNFNTATKTWNIVKAVKDVQDGKGYWIYSERDCVIKILGIKEIQSNDVKQNVINGWNQIGAPASSSDFNSIKCGGGTIDKVLSYDSLAESWKVLTGGDNLEKYKGYFMKVSGCN